MSTNILEACAKGNEEVLKAFFAHLEPKKRQLLRNLRDNHDFGPVHHAVQSKSLPCLRLLLEHKQVINLKHRSYEGWTPLFLATVIPTVDAEVVRLLLDAEPAAVDIRNNEKVTPLHRAAENNRLDLVQLLVAAGANVNATDLDLETALHYAVRAGSVPIVQHLVECGRMNATLLNESKFNALCLTFGMPFAPALKLSLIELLLPVSYPTDRDGHYDMLEIFKPAVLSCDSGNNPVSEFFLERFYSAASNRRHELVDRLRPHSHLLCFFVHHELRRYSDVFYRHFFILNALDIEIRVLQTLQTLIGRPDTFDLSCAVAEELFAIGFDEIVRDNYLCGRLASFDAFLGTFSPPFPTPRDWFRFFYRLIDSTADNKIFALLASLLSAAIAQGKERRFVEHVLHLTLPFANDDFYCIVIFESDEYNAILGAVEPLVPHRFYEAYAKKVATVRRRPRINGEEEQEGEEEKPVTISRVFSLKRFCRDQIREQITLDYRLSLFDASTTTERRRRKRNFVDGVLSMPIPKSLKCYLLHVTDPEWIDGL